MTETITRRPIRSYVLRMGRMTSGQQRAFDQNWERWGLEAADGILDFDAVFGRAGPRVSPAGCAGLQRMPRASICCGSRGMCSA